MLAAMAESLTKQAESAVLSKAGRLRRVPGLDVDGFIRDKLRLDDAVRGQLAGISGDVVDSSLVLADGVARTTLTMSLADPRQGKADDDARYPLTFTGTVDVETLALGMTATVPRNLIEKWAGENPGDLVDLFGDRPFRTLLGEGLTLRFDGTTPAPRVDATEELDGVAERAVQALLDNAGTDLLRKGLKKGLGDLFR